jgi:cytochrome c-type biogenesis protein CcmE
MKLRQLGLLLAIAAVGLLLLFSLSQNLSQYSDFTTARANPGREVHVVGQWVQRDQTTYDAATDRFTFYLRDSLGTVQQIEYFDPQPANFEQADRVVLIGRCAPKSGTKPETFVADKILMKCPSKYQDNTLPAYEQPKEPGQGVRS